MIHSRPVIVVSFCAAFNPLTPRAERTRILASALEERFELAVQRVSDEHKLPVALKVLNPVLLDRYEPLAVWQLSRWSPGGLGALLIGYPVSPLYYAAKRLVRYGVPYVVDVGDPWALTVTGSKRGVRDRRRAHAESFLWRNAAGGVVTTASQAAALQELFPDLSFLCRPNGYQEVQLQHGVSDRPPRSHPGDELRLVHFGNMYWARLDLANWLSLLRRAAGLRRVHLTNFGESFHGSFHSEDPHITVETRAPVEWDEVCRLATEFDGAIVVGNKNPAQLPSKALQYLTLPIPRIAVTVKHPDDALANFAAAKPGFIAVDLDSADDALEAVAHLRRPWSLEELEPPASDAWAEVAGEITQFVVGCWNARGSSRPIRPRVAGEDQLRAQA